MMTKPITCLSRPKAIHPDLSHACPSLSPNNTTFLQHDRLVPKVREGGLLEPAKGYEEKVSLGREDSMSHRHYFHSVLFVGDMLLRVWVNKLEDRFALTEHQCELQAS